MKKQYVIAVLVCGAVGCVEPPSVPEQEDTSPVDMQMPDMGSERDDMEVVASDMSDMLPDASEPMDMEPDMLDMVDMPGVEDMSDMADAVDMASECMPGCTINSICVDGVCIASFSKGLGEECIDMRECIQSVEGYDDIEQVVCEAPSDADSSATYCLPSIMDETMCPSPWVKSRQTMQLNQVICGFDPERFTAALLVAFGDSNADDISCDVMGMNTPSACHDLGGVAECVDGERTEQVCRYPVHDEAECAGEFDQNTSSDDSSSVLGYCYQE